MPNLTEEGSAKLMELIIGLFDNDCFKLGENGKLSVVYPKLEINEQSHLIATYPDSGTIVE